MFLWWTGENYPRIIIKYSSWTSLWLTRTFLELHWDNALANSESNALAELEPDDIQSPRKSSPPEEYTGSLSLQLPQVFLERRSMMIQNNFISVPKTHCHCCIFFKIQTPYFTYHKHSQIHFTTLGRVQNIVTLQQVPEITDFVCWGYNKGKQYRDQTCFFMH